MIHPVVCPQPSRSSHGLRRPAGLAALVAGAALAGCGGSGTAAPRGDPAATPQGPGVVAAPGSGARSPAARAIAPGRASRATVARVDATSDATLAMSQATVSAGAPSDAEVRREIAQARRQGIVLPSGDTVASFASSAAEASLTNAEAAAVGASIPTAAWNPHHRPIADWIVPILRWAGQHGWTGAVTSGYRTYYEQAELNAAGDFSAPAGASNHESTAYPGGAVDVTKPADLIHVLATYPGLTKLNGGVLGPIDPEHFSATGA